MTIYGFFILLGGVGLFLFGMSMMSSGLESVCGERLQVILEHATRNKLVAVLIGLVVTLLIQSSSATDVMVIGFVNSGMMNLVSAACVILGANIGTTITAQITAINLTAYAPFILFVGAALHLFVKNNTVRHVGSIILGFGMLFEGIALMKGTIAPLAQDEGFIRIVSTLSNPLVTILFGVAFTALLQSSSSSTVIFQAFAVQGILTYDTTVYLVIGAAIGSVTPNLLAGLTSGRSGKRTALVNLLFNLFRAMLLCLLIALFPRGLELIRSLSPNNVARQIANTHTIFSVIAVCAALPFTKYLVKLTELLIPIRPEEIRSEDRKLVYMNQMANLPGSVALEQAHREIVRMGRISVGNLEAAVESFFSGEDNMDSVEETEDVVNYLDRAIIQGLVDLRTMDISHRELTRVYYMTLVVQDIERLSDHAENIAEYAAQVRTKKAVLSPTALDELKGLAELSLRSVKLCLDIFATEDFSRLDEAEELEDAVDDLQDALTQSHVNRLMSATCDPLGGIVFTDMATDLERCSDHAINIACALSKHPS